MIKFECPNEGVTRKISAEENKNNKYKNNIYFLYYSISYFIGKWEIYPKILKIIV